MILSNDNTLFILKQAVLYIFPNYNLILMNHYSKIVKFHNQDELNYFNFILIKSIINLIPVIEHNINQTLKKPLFSSNSALRILIFNSIILRFYPKISIFLRIYAHIVK